MKNVISVTDLDSVKKSLVAIVSDSGRQNNVSYVDVRLEATEGVGAYVEDSNPKQTSKDWSLSLGVRVIAGAPYAAAGYYGRVLGISDFLHFEKVLKEGISIAKDR